MKTISLFLFLAVLFISFEVSAAKGPTLVCRDITGDVYAGYAKTFNLEVKNDGNEPLDIHEIRTSCTCTVPGLKRLCRN